jgi:hypothetical protein
VVTHSGGFAGWNHLRVECVTKNSNLLVSVQIFLKTITFVELLMLNTPMLKSFNSLNCFMCLHYISSHWHQSSCMAGTCMSTHPAIKSEYFVGYLTPSLLQLDKLLLPQVMILVVNHHSQVHRQAA